MIKIKEKVLDEKDKDDCLNNEEKHIITFKEKEIAKECNEIILKYKGEFSNEKEEKKKKIELFHLLTLLKQYDINIEIKEIRPNEPGDFILIDGGGNQHLVEIFTVFGAEEECKLVNENIRKLLEFKDDDINEVNKEYSPTAVDQLLNTLRKKNNMYFKEEKIKSTILLVVTTESNLCAITGSWIEKYARQGVKDIIKNSVYDNIYVLDYYSSGRDGLETAWDLEERIDEYIKIMES